MRFSLLILLFLSLTAGAQPIIPFDSPRWKITGNGFVQETHLGRPAYRLAKGAALLDDVSFKNGTIEFDIALAKERYFPAIEFRVQDENNYEQYYLRPHQSGNPDAMQYTPVYNNSAGWQLYYGEGYNNPVILPFDRWLHVKLVVLGSQAEVYFDQDTTPVLFIRHLRRDIAGGKIKLSNMAPSPAWYSNFTYTSTDAVTIGSKAAPVPPLPSTVITSWQVSRPFNEKQITNKFYLSAADTAKLSWKHLNADELGVTDLAMLSGVDSNSNTVFVKRIIYADKPGIQKLSFGFSDRAKVYLNNRLQYAGEDGFMSRDYRFLGTIGYFDAVYLDLKKGRNELWIAVSEDFGGWGIKAKLE